MMTAHDLSDPNEMLALIGHAKRSRMQKARTKPTGKPGLSCWRHGGNDRWVRWGGRRTKPFLRRRLVGRSVEDEPIAGGAPGVAGGRD